MSSTVTVAGNLTRDPELRFTTGARGVASFGIASTRRYNQNGEWQEQTSFFNVVCWGDLGSNVAESFHKGDKVLVTGRLDQQRWEDKDGNNRSSVEIVADDVAASVRWATVEIQKVNREVAAGVA